MQDRNTIHNDSRAKAQKIRELAQLKAAERDEIRQNLNVPNENRAAILELQRAQTRNELKHLTDFAVARVAAYRADAVLTCAPSYRPVGAADGSSGLPISTLTAPAVW